MVLRSNGLMIGYRDGNRRMFVFPPSVITATVLVYGGKGMGKTNLLSVTLEEMSKRDLKWCSIDPIGVHYGLRHAPDGKGDGVKCAILGGVHGDIAIYPDSGEIVADLVADNDTNVIIDCSRNKQGQMWTVGERTRFITAFVLRLFQRQGSLVNGRRREPLFVALDEAARYIPQMIPAGPNGIDLAKSLGAWEQLVEEGRNVGIGVGLFTQRSARINKSVAELADVMIAFRTTGPNSINAIIDWLGEHVPKTDQRTMIEQVRKLPVGGALVVSPGWLEYEGVVQVRARETFDSSATPKPGQRAKRIHGRGATVDLAAYEQRMAEAIERAEAEDPKKLRARIAELEKTLKSQIKVETPTQVITERVVEPDRQLIDRTRTVVVSDIRDLAQRAEKIAADLLQTVTDAESRAGKTIKPNPALQRSRATKEAVARPRVAKKAVAVAPPPPPPDEVSDIKLGKGERKVLEVLAEFPEGRTHSELAFLAGYSAKASTLGVILANLRRGGLVAREGNPIRPTTAGLEAAGGVKERLTGDALLQKWMSHPRMGTGERTVLAALLDSYPDDISHNDLCAVTGYSPDASTMGVILSKLRKLGLVEKGRRRVLDEFMASIGRA